MRALLLTLVVLASAGPAAASIPPPSAAALDRFGDRVPWITTRPSRDALLAREARATALDALRADPQGQLWIVDTATTHIRLDLPRLLQSDAFEYSPALLSAVVDLDHDAWPEVVSVSPISDSVTIHSDVAADDIDHVTRVALPGSAYGLASGDLDGDGHTDLVCSTWDLDVLTLLRGDGNGGFAAPEYLPTGPGARGVTLADLDSDGDLDLVSTCDGDSTVRIWHGRGDGQFDVAGTYTAGLEPLQVLARDVTGDGQPDLVCLDRSGVSLSCFVNLGAGVFSDRIRTVITSPSRPCGNDDLALAIAAGDLDDDGDLDLAVSVSWGGLLMLGDGAGNFVLDPTFASAGDPYHAGVAIADLDGDGRLDVLIGGPDQNPGGSFAHFTQVRVHHGLGAGQFEAGAIYHATDNLQSLTVGDVDRDGRPDILAAGADAGNSSYYPSGVSVLLNRGGERLGGSAAYTAGVFTGNNFTSVHSTRGIRLGGPLDDIVVGGGADLFLMVNRAARGFAPPVWAGRGALVAVRDLDLDGDDDVLLQRADTIEVLRGLPTHGLEPAGLLLSGRWFVAIGEFSADGIPDLVVRDAGGALFLARGDGTGGVGELVSTGVTLQLEGAWRTLALAGNGTDLDRDGLDELVVFREQADLGGHGETPPDTLDVFHASLSGQFALHSQLAVPRPLGSTGATAGFPQQILPADFDGDGWIDLFAMRTTASYCCTSGSFAVLMNRGGGVLEVTEADWPIRSEASEATIVDLNGDLRDDVLISIVNSNDTGAIQWLVSKGDGTFARGYRNDLGDYLNSVGVGRFDGDSRLDITIAAGRNLCLKVIMNTTPWPSFATPVLASLVTAAIEDGVARLAWSTDAAPGIAARVMRSVDGAAFAEVARLHPDGEGRVRYEDRGVASGHRYGYRLAFAEGGQLVTVNETWLEMPLAATLALAGATPNPVEGDLMVAFSLAQRGPGTLGLFDLAGRRIASHDLTSMEPGAHRVRLAPGGAVAPGLYFIRLVTPERALVARAIVVR